MIAPPALARVRLAWQVAVDLRDARVTDEEGVILAELLQRLPKLTSIDVRGNPGLGPAAIAALCQALRDEKPGHPRSLCGVSPLNTRLDVPRAFSPEQATDLQVIVAELENHLYSESVTAGMGGKATGGVIQLNRRGGGGGGGGESKGGWQPLIWAARACHVQVAEQLLKNGARVNEQEKAGSNSSKSSPLHMACHKGHIEMVPRRSHHGAPRSGARPVLGAPLKLLHRACAPVRVLPRSAGQAAAGVEGRPHPQGRQRRAAEARGRSQGAHGDRRAP